MPMISFLQSFGLEHPHLLAQMQSRLFLKPNRPKKPKNPMMNFLLSEDPHYQDILTEMKSSGLLGDYPCKQVNLHSRATDLLESFGFEDPRDQCILDRMKSEVFLPHRKRPEDPPSVFTRNVFRYSSEARWAFDLLFTDLYGQTKEDNYIPGYPKEEVDSLRLGLRFIKQRLSAKSYDLGSMGRFQLNRKLGLSKPSTALTLTLDDLICIVNYLLHIQDGVFPVDDIDHLKNRRVRFSGELISNQLSTGLIALERISAKRSRQSSEIRNAKRIHQILNIKCVNGALKEFFHSSQLSQFMDQTNALAEITHKRRLSSLGPGGITRETAGMQIRGIHPSHYGRICPIETPEGPNAGLVNSLTTYARINEHGFLETPFYKVIDGQIQNENQVIYLSADQDELKHIAPPDLKTEELACLKGNSIPVKIGSEFTKTAKSNVEFMSVSRVQMISVATSLIPFLEHDDANRALMGSNMQRQSVPVIKPERAIVGTGLEGRVVSDSGHSIQARESGYVTYASAVKIQILSFLKTKSEKVPCASCGARADNLNFNNSDNEVIRVGVVPRSVSAGGRSAKQVPRSVSAGGRVPRGRFHAKDITIGIRGKNAQQNTGLRSRELGSPFFATKDRQLLKASESGKAPPGLQANIITYYLQDFTRSNQNTCLAQRPLVKVGDWVDRGACLADCASSAFGELAIGKNITVAYLPWEGYNFEDAILVSERLIYDDLYTSIHIVKHKTEIRATKHGLENITCASDKESDIEAFANLDRNGIVKIGACVGEGDILVRKVTPIGKPQLSAYQKFLYVVVDKQAPTVKDTSLRVPKGLRGRVIDIKVRTNPKGTSLEAVYVWIAEKKWLQVGDKMAGRHGNKGIVSQILPRHDMPYLPDGTPVDMVLNPLGVPSRMNVGQIFENLLGLAGKHLNQHYKILPFDEVTGPEASRSITFTKLYEARQKTGKTWLFQPTNPGKARIFDGRTGEAFDQPVTIGHPYMLKLIHLVDEKIHARATGPYSLVTQQPLRGRSKHGGQRFGEMEVWALEGFGAAYTLQEILTIKSDDIYGRQQIMNYLLKGQPLQIGRPESFRVLIRELQALCVSVEIYDYPIKDTTRHRRDPIDLDSREFNKYD